MPTVKTGRSPNHVCIFTTAHPTDDVRVNSKIAASLLEAGHRVTWVGPAHAYFASSVNVDPRITYRLVRHAKSRIGRLTAFVRIAWVACKLGPVDWWYSPDPDAALAATVLARWRGGQVIFDIHEVFDGALLDRWLRGRQLQPIRTMVRKVIAQTSARSDIVIGVNASVLALYAKRQTGSLVIRNCAPHWFSGRGADPQPEAPPMRIMHGKVIPSNGTPVVLAALEAMKSEPTSVQVVMLDVTNQQDPFTLSVRRRILSSEIVNEVQIVHGVPHREMPKLLGAAHVGMIAYGRGLGEDSLPNRLFEYMAVGLAILAPSYACEIVQIIESEGIGITADFDDPADVVRALAWLRDHPDERAAMGARGQRAFVERHSWEHEFDKLSDAMRG